MGWLLEQRGRASVGQWLGTALLVVGVVTGQLRAPQVLYAAWLENVSVAVAATVSLVRSGRATVAVPDWMRSRIGRVSGELGRAWAAPVSQPPPPPPSARREGPPPPPPSDGSRLSLPAAVLLLLAPLAVITSAQGSFIGVLGRLTSVGGEASSGGGPLSLAGDAVAVVLLLAAAAARALRRIDPDEALGYAFGHVLTLHLGMFLGFFATIAAVIGGLLDSGRRGPLEIVVTLALVGWFVATDRRRFGQVPSVS